MNVAAYLRSGHRDERLRVEAFCKQSFHKIVATVEGKTRHSQLMRLVKSRKIQGVVVRELADATTSTAAFLDLIRQLALYDCKLIVTQGVSLDGLAGDTVLRITDIVTSLRKSMFEARSRRNKEKQVKVGPAKLKDLYGVKNGERIAQLLQEEKPLSIRRIATVAGVAPNTVMTVKRMLAGGAKPVEVYLMGIPGLDG